LNERLNYELMETVHLLYIYCRKYMSLNIFVD
jgi:hypothetical protein